MKRYMAACAMVLAMAGSQCVADIVHARDGKKYEGTVTRVGEKVTVATANGTVELDAGDIILIEPSSGGPAPSPGATGAPAATPAGGATSMPAFKGMDVTRLAMPEAVAFISMRHLAVEPPGLMSAQLRQQVDTWRANAHDRKRRAGSEWFTPEDFGRHRKSFVNLAKEAADLAKKAKPMTPTGKPDPNYPKNFAVFEAKVDQALHVWLDPLTRDFLQGVAACDANRFTQAGPVFRDCTRDNNVRRGCPFIPAFYQGWSMALTEEDHASDAVARLLDALTLRPDSSDLLYQLKATIKRMPGSEIKADTYVRAKKMLDEFDLPDKPATTLRNINWQMPGHAWSVRDETLPIPPYDRLVFRQGAAVPVAARALLVDAAVVKDATDVYVQVGEGKFVPAYVLRRVASLKPLPPLAVLVTTSCEFTPAEIEDSNRPPQGNVRGYGLDFFFDMGSTFRKFSTSLTAEGADVKTALPLLAGEGASPLLTDKGVLVGFLAGKTDVAADNGGPNAVITLSQVAAVMKLARDPKLKPDFESNYSRAKYLTAPVVPTVKGEAFIIQAIVPEKLE